MPAEILKRKIKTTEDLRSIVSTMKALSSVSILQYEQANAALEKYRRNLKDAFHALVLRKGVPFVAARKAPKKKYLLILVGTDNGMVGKFNKELLEQAESYLQKQNVPLSEAGFIVIGKRMTMLAERDKLRLFARYAVSNSVKTVVSVAETVMIKLNEVTEKEHITNVSVWYHRRRAGKSVQTECREIIPFDMSGFQRLKNKPWGTNNIPLVPLSKEKLFSALVNEYLTVDMASQLNYSLAAEHYTRMTNMQNAEKNIDENLEKMHNSYQQQRQDEITSELIDVVSGAAALK